MPLIESVTTARSGLPAPLKSAETTALPLVVVRVLELLRGEGAVSHLEEDPRGRPGTTTCPGRNRWRVDT